MYWTMSKLPFKVSVIGAGYMAREHIRAFQNIPDVKVTGIYSRTFSRAKALGAEFGIEEICNSIDLLFEKSQADLVVIAVPELSVRNVCLEAFKYPWLCLIEKPAGYDVADAEMIVEAAKKHKTKAFVAMNRRHYCSTKTVLSDLKTCTGQRLIHILDQQDQIQARAAGQPELVVQNWMYANSIHLIDYFKIFARGEIIGLEPIIPWCAANPNFVVAKINFSSGDIGLYEAVWNGPGPWGVTVTTQEKRWELRPLEQAAFQLYGSRKLESVAMHASDIEFKPGLCMQAEEAMKALRGLPHTLPSLKEFLESMYLVQAIYEDGFKHV